MDEEELAWIEASARAVGDGPFERTEFLQAAPATVLALVAEVRRLRAATPST